MGHSRVVADDQLAAGDNRAESGQICLAREIRAAGIESGYDARQRSLAGRSGHNDSITAVGKFPANRGEALCGPSSGSEAGAGMDAHVRMLAKAGRMQELCGFGVYMGLIGHIDKHSPAQLLGSADESHMIWDLA